MINSTTTLGDLVSARPGLARELERRGLDYCCGGDRTLADACADRDIDVHAMIGELASAAAGGGGESPPWALMGVVELIDHIETTHHASLREQLPRLSGLIATIVRVHGDRHPELRAMERDFALLRADLEPHLLAEEDVVFPLFRRVAATASASPTDAAHLESMVAVMRSDHEHVGELLRSLRDVSDGFEVPPDGCATFGVCYAGLSELEADIHLHVHKENNLLLPAVMRPQTPLSGAAR
jgi:regulator of cell morphogenesis and NO signaling